MVLLHQGADSPQLTGLYERGFPDEPIDAALGYRIVRVWRVPAQPLGSWSCIISLLRNVAD